MNLDTRTTVASSCSAATAASMCDRNAFGRDFDAPPHQGDGAVIVPLNLAGCPGFYNYFVVSPNILNVREEP